MGLSVYDTLWVLISATLVFGMQGGFLCLETGLTRSKNAINVALKNMVDFALSFMLFWLFGFGVMFGLSWSGWLGTSSFLLDVSGDGRLGTFFLFQAMFCATAATIVAGAVAERMRFTAYLITTLIVSGFVYPVFGHWAWGGALGGPEGWLAQLGFVDFAGSTVVHGVGGWVALAAAIVVGPRIGRFADGSNKKSTALNTHSNLPVAMFGALALTLGWMGFNGGSTFSFDERVPSIIANTLLAGASAALAGVAISRWLVRHTDAPVAINSLLAGLVSITAGCHVISAPGSILVGTVAAIIMIAGTALLERLRIDDVIGAFPVHGAAAVWGTLAVALLGDIDTMGTGLSRWAQLAVQATGALSAAALAFGTTYTVLRVVKLLYPLRVTPDQEHLGLNVAEHGTSTEIFDLLTEMELQRRSGDFSFSVEAQPYTEVGQIAKQYNRVLEAMQVKTEQTEQANDRLRLARDQEEAARAELQQSVRDLEAFNQLAVGRELRMIELKEEVNALASQLGQAARYETTVDDPSHTHDEVLLAVSCEVETESP